MALNPHLVSPIYPNLNKFSNSKGKHWQKQIHQTKCVIKIQDTVDKVRFVPGSPPKIHHVLLTTVPRCTNIKKISNVEWNNKINVLIDFIKII